MGLELEMELELAEVGSVMCPIICGRSTAGRVEAGLTDQLGH